MHAQTLQELYHATSETTLIGWAKAPDIGAIKKTGFYDPHKLALVSGIRPVINPPISILLAILRRLAHRVHWPR